MKDLSDTIKFLDNVLWIVVEDSPNTDQEVLEVLPENSIYLSCGPTKDKGHAQRNLALEYIKSHNLRGIIYNLDDDNKYDIRLFNELRKVKNVAFFPVGNLGPHGVERPVVENGKFVRWEANWTWRKYCVDMGGFAFHSDLLKNIESPIWHYKGAGGENEFLQKILKSIDDVEFLCDNCKDVYVWHNGNV
jgi:hypothetical protein